MILNSIVLVCVIALVVLLVRFRWLAGLPESAQAGLFGVFVIVAVVHIYLNLAALYSNAKGYYLQQKPNDVKRNAESMRFC